VAQPLVEPGQSPAPWAEARARLPETATYWLATVRPDGRPHVVPLLAVWVEDRLFFCASASTRKAANLARDPHCVLSVGAPGLDLVIEGTAALVSNEATLRRIAAAYASVYGWRVTVRDGAFHDAEGAPTAGPPPYRVYRVDPATAFGFGTDGTFTPTRWRFPDAGTPGDSTGANS